MTTQTRPTAPRWFYLDRAIRLALGIGALLYLCLAWYVNTPQDLVAVHYGLLLVALPVGLGVLGGLAPYQNETRARFWINWLESMAFAASLLGLVFSPIGACLATNPDQVTLIGYASVCGLIQTAFWVHWWVKRQAAKRS